MSHPLLQAENRLWSEALRKERETLLQLRRSYTIGDDVLHDIQREMDLLSARFHHEETEAMIDQPPPRRRIREWVTRNAGSNSGEDLQVFGS